MFDYTQRHAPKYGENFDKIKWDKPSSVLSADIWDKYIYNRFVEESKADNTTYAAYNAPRKGNK